MAYNYGLMPQIDACLPRWPACIPATSSTGPRSRRPCRRPLPFTGSVPRRPSSNGLVSPAKTPHYVLSTTLTVGELDRTRFLRGLDEVAALKDQPGKDIYLSAGVDGPSLVDAGLVDELRLHVHPLIAGAGTALLRRRTGAGRSCFARPANWTVGGSV